MFTSPSAAAGAVVRPSLRSPASAPSFAAPSPDGGVPVGGSTARPWQSGAPSPAPAQAVKPCVCGHGRQAHEHYRRGKDCALCSCARYRRRLIGRGR